MIRNLDQEKKKKRKRNISERVNALYESQEKHLSPLISEIFPKKPTQRRELKKLTFGTNSSKITNSSCTGKSR